MSASSTTYKAATNSPSEHPLARLAVFYTGVPEAFLDNAERDGPSPPVVAVSTALISLRI
jgi:hypothetical protein